MDDQLRSFSSYTGLDRVVLIWGVPLVPFMLLGTLSVFIGFAGQFFFGLVGILFTFIMLPIFFFVRSITEQDDQALRILALEIKFIFKRAFFKEFGNTLTFLPTRYLKDVKRIQQDFE